MGAEWGASCREKARSQFMGRQGLRAAGRRGFREHSSSQQRRASGCSTRAAVCSPSMSTGSLSSYHAPQEPGSSRILRTQAKTPAYRGWVTLLRSQSWGAGQWGPDP